MGRAPCCEKMGLKKGPWTSEEDNILISHIQKHGHTNWRALPKQAGLLRCGKSCRLRWINYLKPDIKRGNFTEEEEETIFNLHEMLGNRWSAIAAKLSGRTDNEIKNVWHTHLKKKLKTRQAFNNQQCVAQEKCNNISQSETQNSQISAHSESPSPSYASMSPQPSSSDLSTITENSTETNNKEDINLSSEIFPVIDDFFWSETEMLESSSSSSSLELNVGEFELGTNIFDSAEYFDNGQNIIDDGMDFWYDLFVKSGGVEELL